MPLSIEEISSYLNAYAPSRWERSLNDATTLEDLDPQELRDRTELVAQGLVVARGKRRAKRFYLP